MFTDDSEVITASIIRAVRKPRGLLIVLMMEAASTFETSVNFYQTTRRNNPEDSHLHTRHRENLKSHSGYLSELRFLVF
jgi:hypothetical protein